MDLITITRPVTVKVRVTDDYKKSLAAEVHGTLSGLESRLTQLSDFEKNNPGLSAQGLQQIDAERQKLKETRRQLTEKLKEVGRLAEGQEVVHGRVESLVELQLGDNWIDLMSVEVVLKDGKVVEIRQGGSS